MPPTSSIAVNPELDRARLAAAFRQGERLQIADFLEADSADRLGAHLTASDDWVHLIKGKESVFEAPSATIDGLPVTAKAQLEDALFREARNAFRFRYDTIRVPDDDAERERMASPLSDFAQLLCSDTVLGFFREVTGCADIRFADAQATRYRKGDFLTRHDDRVGGKHRSHAFVLSLTAGWNPDWGGLLQLREDDDSRIEAWVPTFNSLSLFTVGQPHSVSYVAPYAAKDRLSVTGWLRTARP